MTAQPPWRLTGSVVPSGLRLKKRRASPFRGFTEEGVSGQLRNMSDVAYKGENKGVPRDTLDKMQYLQCLSEHILRRLHL
jgi:hypothetical protein